MIIYDPYIRIATSHLASSYVHIIYMYVSSWYSKRCVTKTPVTSRSSAPPSRGVSPSFFITVYLMMADTSELSSFPQHMALVRYDVCSSLKKLRS